MAIKEGDKAPDFTGIDENGKEIRLSDYKNKKLVLYFYPKDMTPGCTAEACDLRDNYNRLINDGFEILGVSPDTEERHKKFKEKYELPFPLIADPEKIIIKKYDAWGEKKLYGKTYFGVLRKTYIINEEGKIIKIINKVKTKDHTNQIFNELSK
ncbi:MAG: thioredoxin-dependent thiol peroxidase [Marinilabiliales bacterium]